MKPELVDVVEGVRSIVGFGFASQTGFVSVAAAATSA
jgi:hypothetical protein